MVELQHYIVGRTRKSICTVTRVKINYRRLHSHLFGSVYEVEIWLTMLTMQWLIYEGIVLAQHRRIKVVLLKTQ